MTYSLNQKSTNLLLVLFLFVSAFSFAQEEDKSKKVGVFTFENEEIDYGTIAYNSDGLRVFKFTNTGDAPIVISKAKGSCGCTVPTYSKNVILPGEKGEIQVKYATNRIGKFTKTVMLTTNASQPNKVLRIKGEVLKPETKEAPKS
ncbi:DUF1573 domain-containing protein [Aestuariivivens sp. NBU2969]|uniref:DUF1573 domain-containing protein n=1 Tax=Aestuariivivens sp. NBU2969 TaxID=2873267 RepID=UPI001CBF0748|nr:DUF1573 domain-containing protein [Aestuariivivens sp. NBU2969]